MVETDSAHLQPEFEGTTDPVRASLLPASFSFSAFDRPDSYPVDNDSDPFICKRLTGYGVQSWRWQYFCQSPSCGVALDIPLCGAYSTEDSVDDENSNRIFCGEQLARACLNVAEAGLQYHNQDVRLYVVMDTDTLTFRLVSKKTSRQICEGSGLPELLDILDGIAGIHQYRTI